MRCRVDPTGKGYTGRNRLGYSRLWTDPDPVTNLDMVNHSHLSRQYHLLADSTAPSNSGLSHDNRIFPHHNVMCDLYQVIDFDTALNNGSSKGSAIYSGIGTDLHVIVDLYDSGLGNLGAGPTFNGKTKTIAANDHSSMEENSIPNTASFTNRDLRVENAIGTNLSPVTYKDTGKDNRSGTDLGSGP